MNLLSTNMEDIADIFIRPARHLYKATDLGPKNTVVAGLTVMRTDFEVKNKKGLTLKASLFTKERL